MGESIVVRYCEQSMKTLEPRENSNKDRPKMGKKNKRTKKRGTKKGGEHAGEPTWEQSREDEELEIHGLQIRTMKNKDTNNTTEGRNIADAKNRTGHTEEEFNVTHGIGGHHKIPQEGMYNKSPQHNMGHGRTWKYTQ